uniref:Odorant-binding protein n=1 Tax=Anoplophora chinensis TaxID=217632 RepID=A0A2H4ZB32_ANOCN|nr:odorant-binding protein [Anoplophora chinensis]
MKFCFFLLCSCLVAPYVYSAMTEKQLNATKKLMRNTCQNKAKPTSEQIDAMQKGDFNVDRNAQCYLLCILSTYKLLTKENTFDWENGIKALAANAPASVAGPGSATLKNCKDAVKTPSDRCVASIEIAKCIYDDNPSNYFLP